MKTTAIMLQSLCVPCHCRCRYCLLSWDGRTRGADYARSEGYARRFYDWVREHRPELRFSFSFGYSMEHPELFRAIEFLRSIGSPGAEFLQFDGMKFRDRQELERLTAGLAERGVRHLNFTFYGEEDYHDRFAGRRGDFRLMLDTAFAALRSGLNISAGIPLTHENVSQVHRLTLLLRGAGFEPVTLFVPHGEGRGATLEPVRFSKEDFARLDALDKPLLNQSIYRAESDWLNQGSFVPTERRALLISLTPENLDALEAAGFAKVIEAVERLDEAYYSAIPELEVLAKRYGDTDGTKYYRQRDLFAHYRKQYIATHGLRLYDVTDERQCGSRRY